MRNQRTKSAITLRFGAALLLCPVGVCTLGCSSPESSEDAPVRAAMMVLGLQYGQYLGEHDGVPPPDEDTMREFLTSRLDELTVYNVHSADDLLRTGRDGRPLALVTGQTLSSPEHPEYALAAYESEGVAGVRLASNTRGGIYELSAAEFAALIPSSKPPTAGGR